jgi:hypothetical protein
MHGALLLFLIVFLLNLIPAFAPPTWMVFSFIGFRYPLHQGTILALVGALAATLGRVVLARMSHIIIRRRFLSDDAKSSIDAIRQRLEHRRKLTFGVFLFYALSPLPSNYLFIAYGLTAMDLKLIAIPFFLGRAFSYRFWSFTSSSIAGKLSLESSDALSYFTVYFVLSQLLLLAVLYAFTKVDWRVLLTDHKWKWLRKAPRDSLKRS